MKKALLLAAVLAALSFGTVDASRFEMVQKSIVQGAYAGVDSADFKEGKKTVRFMSVSEGPDDYTLKAISKPNWLLNFDPYWTYSVKASSPKAAPDYIIEQYRDVDTGKYFYGVNDIRFKEEGRRAFLLGFDEKKKSMITYIDSDTMEKPEYSAPGTYVRKGSLFLGVGEYGGNWKTKPAYKLDWSPEAKWFSYEYFEHVAESPYW